ncbi:MAG TPA: matrixin family metalloprotease [Methylomirabilota bacterium]|nr:matrixin family metalloprotease [Methylomirabilota bacterium]
MTALAAATGARASETELSGAEGHPRGHLPLRVWAQPLNDPGLDDAVRRAIEDWNRVSMDALGVGIFTPVAERADAQVTVEIGRDEDGKLMGQTELRTGERGVIDLPVRIVIVEPKARGQTSRETLLYQVVAHELGHALGLPHVRDPRSLMCCVHGSVDFNDPVARDAYIEARRHPDVGSARAELREHYMRFWPGRR